MRYRSAMTFGQLNLLDSHDVSRFLSLCGESMDRMKLAVLFQMTFVGMPCVFYGDEKGMTGLAEEEYRRPMPWNQAESPLQPFYQKAIALRSQYVTLRRGTFRVVYAQPGGGLYHYARALGGETVGVILNNGDAPQSVSVPGKILWQERLEGDILGAYGFVVYHP